jgi:hypothetical protein
MNKTGNVRNIGALSCDHCFRGKAISITYSECVSVVLAIQHEMRIFFTHHYIVTCGLSGRIILRRVRKYLGLIL